MTAVFSFGNEKAWAWTTAILVQFFWNVFVESPIKVGKSCALLHSIFYINERIFTCRFHLQFSATLVWLCTLPITCPVEELQEYSLYTDSEPQDQMLHFA